MSIVRAAINIMIQRELLNWMPDEPYLKLLFWCYMRRKLDLNNPETYNEKLQWLKLHDRKPIYTTMVDKYEAKSYVAEKIGAEYVEIDFDLLPERFVLKSTHDSGGIVIVDKQKGYDRKKIISFLKSRLRHGTYEKQREWPYKDVPRRVIAEQFMEDDKTKELRDYKFFCFNGEVKALFIATDRQSDRPTAFDFFDPDFAWMDIRHGHPNAPVKPEKPENFELMKKLAAKLSEGFCQLRVDFYEINGRVYFGELTFFHHGGVVPFDPEKWDKIFGDWVDLSNCFKEK